MKIFNTISSDDDIKPILDLRNEGNIKEHKAKLKEFTKGQEEAMLF
jgi:hypothetical protein